MAWNHRGEYIADPHLNRLRDLKASLQVLRDDTPYATEEDAREWYDIPKGGEDFPGVEGRSEMGDAHLMPDTDAPISVTERAFGESGHGYSVRKEKKGQ
jgi:hypothetical protein